jgi:hypothetical protein
LQHQLPVASPYEQEQDAIALGDRPQLTQILNLAAIDRNYDVARPQTTLRRRAAELDFRYDNAGNGTGRTGCKLRPGKAGVYLSAGTAGYRLLTERCSH